MSSQRAAAVFAGLVVALLAESVVAEAGGAWRVWRSRSGQEVYAQLVDVQGDQVMLQKADGKTVAIQRANLAPAEQAILDALSPPTVESRLLGEWTGYSVWDIPVRHRVTVRRERGQLAADDTLLGRLGWDQADAARKGKLRKRDASPSAFVTTQSYAVRVDGTNVIFEGRLAEYLFAEDSSATTWPVQTFYGTYAEPGLLTGYWTNGAAGGRFNWIRAGALEHKPPSDLVRGAVHEMTCLDGSPYTYTLYIPRGYDPTKPTPLLINDSPWAKAQPLARDAVETVGWISVGLGESCNPEAGGTSQLNSENCVAVLIDVQRRFNIDLRRVYFSGLSGGARRASMRGIYFPDFTAGLICVGAGFAYFSDGRYVTPPLNQPAYFIVGEEDAMCFREVTERCAPGEKERGRTTCLTIHPGRHEWGPPELHEKAVLWLDAQWGEAAGGGKSRAAARASPKPTLLLANRAGSAATRPAPASQTQRKAGVLPASRVSRADSEPKPISFEDKSNDFMRGESHHPAYLDLTRIRFTRQSAEKLLVVLEVAGEIPDRVERLTMYVLNLDLDRNKSTGYSTYQVGGEVSAVVTRDPRLSAWTGDIQAGEDGTRPVGYRVDDFKIRDNRAEFLLQAPDPLVFDRFSFSAHAYVLPEKAVDLLPDSGGQDVSTQASN